MVAEAAQSGETSAQCSCRSLNICPSGSSHRPEHTNHSANANEQLHHVLARRQSTAARTDRWRPDSAGRQCLCEQWLLRTPTDRTWAPSQRPATPRRVLQPATARTARPTEPISIVEAKLVSRAALVGDATERQMQRHTTGRPSMRPESAPTSTKTCPATSSSGKCLPYNN